MMPMRWPTILGAVLLFAAVAPGAAEVDAVATFYKGKTINTYIGVGVGGEFVAELRRVEQTRRPMPAHDVRRERQAQIRGLGEQRDFSRP